jgi:dTDP-glucose pyrophosphorylase
MNHFNEYLIHQGSNILEAYQKLNNVGVDLTLLVVDDERKLVGTLTDGDIRRGIINEKNLDSPVHQLMNKNFAYLHDKTHVKSIQAFKSQNIKLLPVINANGTIEDVLNLSGLKSKLPLDAFIMAGGKGERLKPLTEQVPKPMIYLGEKPIIEHTIDWLATFGIERFYISVNYLKDQIIDYLGDGASKGIKIEYVEESQPLGTAGALSLVDSFQNDVLLANSDLFTNVNYEDLYLKFTEEKAYMAIASMPYNVDIPYAVLREKSDHVTGLSEKPSNTYYVNAGIYILKKSLTKAIPRNTFFDATDLIQSAIDQNKRVVHNSLIGYWIDIGRHEDLKRAQEILDHSN